MNKIFIKLLFSLCLFISFSLKAQKVIESPVYNYSTAGEVEILKVELSDTDTRISFKQSSLVGCNLKFNFEFYVTDNETATVR